MEHIISLNGTPYDLGQTIWDINLNYKEIYDGVPVWNILDRVTVATLPKDINPLHIGIYINSVPFPATIQKRNAGILMIIYASENDWELYLPSLKVLIGELYKRGLVNECPEEILPLKKKSELSKKVRGPNKHTKDLYHEFEYIKKTHPNWSQVRVASEASENLNEYINENTVRYVYRSMGKKWERADRNR